MKILTLVLLLLPFAVHAEPVDMLDFQINELTRRRDELRAEIERCKKNTKKFKIAGVSTLGATGVGVVGNIALHNKIKNMGAGGTSGGGIGVTPDTCASDPVCAWERECEMQGYKVQNCDGDTDCCAADGCPCTK